MPPDSGWLHRNHLPRIQRKYTVTFMWKVLILENNKLGCKYWNALQSFSISQLWGENGVTKKVGMRQKRLHRIWAPILVTVCYIHWNGLYCQSSNSCSHSFFQIHWDTFPHPSYSLVTSAGHCTAQWGYRCLRSCDKLVRDLSIISYIVILSKIIFPN